MELELTIKPEDTGKNNYSDIKNCPIASGLKDANFKDVSVGVYAWEGKKKIGIFNFLIRGFIGREVNDLAHELADNKQELSTKISLIVKETLWLRILNIMRVPICQ